MLIVHALNASLFCSESNASKAQSDEAKKKDGTKGDLAEFPHRRRNIFLAVLFVVAAMTGFAFAHGLVQITISDDDSSMRVKQSIASRSEGKDVRFQKHQDILEESTGSGDD